MRLEKEQTFYEANREELRLKYVGKRVVIDKHNVVDYYLNSDAFCLTSAYEGLPISLIEALSHGCVPICTPAGGIFDVIKHKETGYLSEDISEASYLNILQYYLDHKDAISK